MGHPPPLWADSSSVPQNHRPVSAECLMCVASHKYKLYMYIIHVYISMSCICVFVCMCLLQIQDQSRSCFELEPWSCSSLTPGFGKALTLLFCTATLGDALQHLLFHQKCFNSSWSRSFNVFLQLNSQRTER